MEPWGLELPLRHLGEPAGDAGEPAAGAAGEPEGPVEPAAEESGGPAGELPAGPAGELELELLPAEPALGGPVVEPAEFVGLVGLPVVGSGHLKYGTLA